MPGDKTQQTQEEWEVATEGCLRGVAILQADNGTYYQMEESRARRVAQAVNAYEPLVKALEAAEGHIAELREAWQRGAIKEYDGQGGTRSNRNADVHRQIQAALTAAGRKP